MPLPRSDTANGDSTALLKAEPVADGIHEGFAVLPPGGGGLGAGRSS
ncbi:hypothetical protein [Streptomyces sp. bgisy029]